MSIWLLKKSVPHRPHYSRGEETTTPPTKRPLFQSPPTASTDSQDWLFWIVILGVRQLYGFFKMDIMLIEPAMSQVCGMSHQETLPWDESMKEQVVEDIPIPCLTSPLCPKRLCVRTLQSLQWRLSHCHENCNRSSRLEIWFSVMCMLWHTHLM